MSKSSRMTSRALMAFYFAAFFFALGKFTYFDGDGYGFSCPASADIMSTR